MRTERMALVLVLLPGGTFWMGSQPRPGPGAAGARNLDCQAPDNELPVHAVTLAPFLMSKYPITQAQWQHVTGANPCYYKPGQVIGDREVTLLHPAENMSWLEGLPVLRQLGLVYPTEAQWEYACRAGTETPWWTGAEKETLAGAANLADQAATRADLPWPGEAWLDDGFPVHSPVGHFRANPWGLHDVHGNVYEWCLDWFAPYTAPVSDPAGTRCLQGGQRRVIRGGSAAYGARPARSSDRDSCTPDFRSSLVGIRPARAIDARPP